MTGKLAIVSGAAQGIGAAVVAALVNEGIRVAALDIQAAPLKALVAQHGDLVTAYSVDISRSRDVTGVVDRIESELGAVDMLANVAGILRISNITECTDEDWEQTFAVNTHGLFYLSRAVAGYMVARQRGSIVTVGSKAAAIPRMQMAAYAASKAAACHFAKCLALELAQYGIRCNIVSPGSTDTDMQRQLWQSGSDASKVIAGSLPHYRTGIPLGRIAHAADIAATVLFLLSDQARHITMHDLRVDGGATLGA
jgi:2,3-dihydro-2,3-dihydroxybenzoate dehydrogenase